MRQEKSGARGRTDHSLTSAGKKYLKNGWHALLDDGPSGDLDADLRVALLVLWAGGKRQTASDFLRQSALKKLELLKSLEAAEDGSVSSLADWYARLRLSSAKVLLQAESDAALQLAEGLPPRLPANATRTKRIAKP